MTKKEANTKWCPMVRFNNNGANRWMYADTEKDNPIFARCIASDCMMWRWISNGELIAETKDTKTYAAISGYCGLGGKP